MSMPFNIKQIVENNEKFFNLPISFGFYLQLHRQIS